jgi:hypothetical protein
MKDWRKAVQVGFIWGSLITLPVSGQQENISNAQLIESGHVEQAGRSTPYLIHRLPVSSFPQLPAAIAAQLTLRGCMIPQTYAAHHPENVIHASFETPGSSDWAVLCEAEGTVSLLVFLASAPENPLTLASAPQTARLQVHDLTGVLGFNWGIDPATPDEVHVAQAAMPHHPPRIAHDALADSTVEGPTLYRFYAKSSWTLLPTPE